MKNIKWSKYLWLLFVIFACKSEQLQLLKPFFDDSLRIITSHNDKPFILLLWSLDCPPCYEELETIGKSDQSQVDYVIISTDDISRVKEAQKVLTDFNVLSNDLWIFSTESKERLRYSIDPQWRGELPRSYLFKNHLQEDFHSGTLTKKKLKSWIRKSNNIVIP
ncbi:MAG: hypothetical protein JKY19_13185 [Alcanivoracaceae bacterium]|nr:hypothetical protein [Alcanivoracaceae bacterium]